MVARVHVRVPVSKGVRDHVSGCAAGPSAVHHFPPLHYGFVMKCASQHRMGLGRRLASY